MRSKTPPIVLVFAGNDPSGGAGLCADIQALANTGCHTAPIVTCITVQDTVNILENIPLSGQQVSAQALAVLADLPIAACKIGLLGSVEIIQAVSQVLSKYPSIPVILDPILAAGGGQPLANAAIRQAMIEQLLPLTHILTPNSQEARQLTNVNNTLEAAAIQIMQYGCQSVCITGTHENTDNVVNSLYGKGKFINSWTWERLPASYHGSGCTFASNLAGYIAQGDELMTAVYAAQQDTWMSLQHGYQAGRGQALPNRLYRQAN